MASTQKATFKSGRGREHLRSWNGIARHRSRKLLPVQTFTTEVPKLSSLVDPSSGLSISDAPHAIRFERFNFLTAAK